MEEYGFKWQMFVGMGLLALLVATLFLPRLTVSGEQYVDFAVDVNRYAKDQDEEAAEKTNADEITEDYGRDGDKRESAIEDYDREIDERTGDHGRISGLYLGKWALTVEDTLYFDGVTFEQGKKIEDSGVQDQLKLYGVLLYLPPVLALVLLVFILVSRKTQAKHLMAVGGLAFFCEGVIRYMLPSRIWNAVEGYVNSFDLVSAQVLEIDNVGKYAISDMLQEFTGPAWIAVVCVSALLILAGILFQTALKPGQEREEEDFPIPYGPVVWDKPPIAVTAKKPEGMITGVTGQYQGQTAYICAGEEVILGRDPKYCMLVFDYPKISRRHCGIRYDAGSNTYYVIDYASNGTKLQDGTVLSTSEYTQLLPGTVILLGNGKETVRLG